MNQAQKFFQQGLYEDPKLQQCPEPKEEDEIDIPDSYDFRLDELRKDCVQPVRKTGNCTGSHVLSAISVVEDRMCIQKDGTETFQLSAQDAISCDEKNFKCGGGYVSKAFDYGTTHGFVKEECFAHTGQNTTCPTAPNACRENGEAYAVAGYCALTSPEAIKRDIIKNGPVVSVMSAYTDFLTHKDGIYFPKENGFKFEGNHMVKIIGWGSEMTGSYWIIENSWGSDWGENGYAKILSGRSELGLDQIALAPVPTTMLMPEFKQYVEEQRKAYEAQIPEEPVEIEETQDEEIVD